MEKQDYYLIYFKQAVMEKLSVKVSVDVYINASIECSDQTIICKISSKFSNFLCFIYYFVHLGAVSNNVNGNAWNRI